MNKKARVKKKVKATLAHRRWLNRHFIWPQRKVNRLIVKKDTIMRLALLKCRQWGTSPGVFAIATRLYRQLKYEANSSKQ